MYFMHLISFTIHPQVLKKVYQEKNTNKNLFDLSTDRYAIANIASRLLFLYFYQFLHLNSLHFSATFNLLSSIKLKNSSNTTTHTNLMIHRDICIRYCLQQAPIYTGDTILSPFKSPLKLSNEL